MSRPGSLVLPRRAALAAFAVSAALLLAASALALAATAVSIVDTGGQFAFQPSPINVTVGQSVTWTDNTDAPHTISSDSASGPLNGSVSPTGTYRATFTKAGDFAYHCNIHSYMHGTVHVAGLPVTDAAAANTGATNDTGATSTSLLLALAAIGSLLVLTGFGLRLRRRQHLD